MDRSNDPRYNFYASPTVDELIAQQGQGPIDDPKVVTVAAQACGRRI